MKSTSRRLNHGFYFIPAIVVKVKYPCIVKVAAEGLSPRNDHEMMKFFCNMIGSTPGRVFVLHWYFLPFSLKVGRKLL